MKGKNKLSIMLFAVVAIFAATIGFVFKGKDVSIPYAEAAEHPGYSAILDDNVVFSVERVYFAEDQSKSLTKGDYNFNAIETNGGTKYFGDYGLYNGLTNYQHKDVVRDGNFVMLNDTLTEEAMNGGENVSIKQGVMITFGGYYYNDEGNIVTNKNTFIDKNDNNQQDADEIVENGAKIQYTLVSVKLTNDNGTRNLNEEGLVPGNRSYSSGQYDDFAWFIGPNEENWDWASWEGHYEISVSYMINGVDKQFDFDFYLLLDSHYTANEVVESNSYTKTPTMNYATLTGDAATEKKYEYDAGVKNEYPTLTFDYTRYKLSYTHISGDVQKKVELNYDQSANMLSLDTSLYDDTTSVPYTIQTFGNNIVTLMFVEHGIYEFDFKYIYMSKSEQVVIVEDQIDYSKVTLNMTLNIYGYQLKYSKAGYASADMTYLEIYQNKTMFILVNGFTDASEKKEGSVLGVQYKLVKPTEGQKTGEVSKRTSGAIITTATSIADLGDVDYPKTDRGLWFSLNDEYCWDGSIYYHSSTQNDITSKGANDFTKVTIFTEPGYYLVQVKYTKSTDTSNPKPEYTQYFAFQITATTPTLDLYKTTAESFDKVDNTGDVNKDNTQNFYAYEYTNQNVYANWRDTEIFESSISAKLYYSTNNGYLYYDIETLKAVADGKIGSTNIKGIEYNKNEFITESRSYLLVLEVEKSATKTYTYFTIDKEGISGLQVYQVYTSIGNKTMYTIARDKNLNPIRLTSHAVIDADFTIGWNNKASGATISASYTYTPFVKNQDNTAAGNEIVAGGNKYIINDYTVGATSNSIAINKPMDLTSVLNANNVLSKQGIYEFTLEDLAGNIVKYIVVVDRTDAKIIATYGDNESTYINGQLVADDVYLTWGSHKAIDLNGVEGSLINDLLTGAYNAKDYYSLAGNNLSYVTGLFKNVGGKQMLAVEHDKIQINMPQTDKNYKYVIEDGQLKVVYNSGAQSVYDTSIDGGFATAVFEINNKANQANQHNLCIKVYEESAYRYSIGLIGDNNVTAESQTNFSVWITPDDALGMVYSAYEDGQNFETEVIAAGKKTKYSTDGGQTTTDQGEDADIYIKEYHDGQASDDGVFVFEWKVPDATMQVTEVKYSFFRLMSKAELNAVTQKGMYYPYEYVETKPILQTDGEQITNYTAISRGEDKYRSHAINLATATYYEDGKLVSRKVTQAGMYIITHTTQIIDEGDEPRTQKYSNVFFVDRNGIISYSTSNTAEKIVGQLIHASMPNSEGLEKIKYDNFSKQGLKNYSIQDGESQIDYKIYFETNKLPTTIQIPTGKYVTGTIDDKNPITSYENLNLHLTVYFKDTYNILYNGYKGQIIKLSNKSITTQDGYITLSFNGIGVNEGALKAFEDARGQNNDAMISLPGEYVFVIGDTVGKQFDNSGQISDYNTFAFGIRIVKQDPITPVYTYTEIDGDRTDNINATGYELNTNQQYVEIEIAKENKDFADNPFMYNAQVDIANVEIYQTDSDGDTKLWLKLNKGVGSSAYSIDASGINKSNIDANGEQIIRESEDKSSYIIKLDTGLELDNNGQIKSYKEYVYRIRINYILRAGVDLKQYYIYNDYSTGNPIKTEWYYAEYTVNIDRSPEDANLNSLMQVQGQYFEDYHTWMAEQNELPVAEVNKNFAYRNKSTLGDYYALANNLFYQFIESGEHDKAAQSMYALRVDVDTAIKVDELAAVYYRKVDFKADNPASQRMGLLPICSVYSQISAGFNTFDKTRTTYTNKIISANPPQTYAQLLDKNEDFEGCYYEIIEEDKAGNYTQYVIYFIPDNIAEVQLNVHGNNISTDESETTITLSQSNVSNTFIGIDYVDGLTGLVDEGKTYYANINIYNALGVKIKTIYTNSTSKLAEYSGEKYIIQGIEGEIYSAIKEQGNYILEYIDALGRSSRVLINNYTSDSHRLNTAGFGYKIDENGNKYICISDVSSQVDANAYWYASKIEISYDNGNKQVTYTTIEHANGKVVLELTEGTEDDKVKLHESLKDHIILKDGDYKITFTDVAGETVTIPLSTQEGFYYYQLTAGGNTYTKNDVVYTAAEVEISYNASFYNSSVKVYLNDNTDSEMNAEDVYYKIGNTENGYTPITLLPDLTTSYGMLRRFIVELKLADEISQTYEIWIDTRTTNFGITNVNSEDRSEFVTTQFNTDKQYGDYDITLLDDAKYYGGVISETVNITWTRSTSEYYIYNYELFEFVAENQAVERLGDSSNNYYTITPKKDNTTGKYVLKVTIYGKNGTWIASKVHFIYMSTTITGLYEVKNMEDNSVLDYAAIANLNDVEQTFDVNNVVMAQALGYGDLNTMHTVFDSYGKQTAIPVYISTDEIALHANKDNGVDSKSYTIKTSYTEISFYRVFRSNYYTFAILMKVYKVNQDILGTFKMWTGPTKEKNLLNSGASDTIYDPEASYYKLEFGSYNAYSSETALEKHNKIVVEIYYNESTTKKEVVGGDDDTTIIEFKNGGSYTLYVKDLAGNVQKFRTNNSSAYVSKFTIIVMKEVLYTINGSAPIEYAYYDSPVSLVINNYNAATNRNNYDINSISIKAELNGNAYTGYSHPAGSMAYTFSDYGTYLITISAKLLGSDKDAEPIKSHLVFSILNPNEARPAIDFTSIAGYTIKSVHNITKTTEIDVTSKFLDMLQDKSNVQIDLYNKLISYERVAEMLGGTTQGKMKFRVVYEVNNDDLLPGRIVEFSFTLNNEKATINSSIEAGGKTTKTVTLKFNPANIYDQIGDCNLVINGKVVLRIDETSSTSPVEIKVKDVGEHYVYLVGDSGNIATSFNFTIKEPLNVVSIILIVIVAAVVIGIIGTFIWLRTRMKVR